MAPRPTSRRRSPIARWSDAQIALTEPERRFLAELSDLGVRHLIVIVGAAALQGRTP